MSIDHNQTKQTCLRILPKLCEIESRHELPPLPLSFPLPLSLFPSLSPPSPPPSGADGIDFTGFPLMISIPQNTMRACGSVSSIADAIVEGNEFVGLSLLTGVTIDSTRSTATLLIQEDGEQRKQFSTVTIQWKLSIYHHYLCDEFPMNCTYQKPEVSCANLTFHGSWTHEKHTKTDGNFFLNAIEPQIYLHIIIPSMYWSLLGLGPPHESVQGLRYFWVVTASLHTTYFLFIIVHIANKNHVNISLLSWPIL